MAAPVQGFRPHFTYWGTTLKEVKAEAKSVGHSFHDHPLRSSFEAAAVVAVGAGVVVLAPEIAACVGIGLGLGAGFAALNLTIWDVGENISAALGKP
jgi:hypothetical protein